MCEHREFLITGVVTRLTDGSMDADPEEQTVIGYDLELTVKCDQCDQDFSFPGSVPIGMNPNRITTNADGKELRVPVFSPEQILELKAMEVSNN